MSCCLTSPVCRYGVYTTVLRLLCPEDERIAMPLMFGYLGVATSLLFAPGLLWAWRAGQLSNLSSVIVGWLLLKGLANNVLSDYFWARAVVLTSPTVVTVTPPFAAQARPPRGSNGSCNPQSRLD
jgi:solute carrier family 35 protein F5